MPDISLTPVHSSMLRDASLGNDGTNTSCHGNTAGVSPNSKHVIDAPQVVLILWDNIFATNAAAVTSANKLVTDLVTGPFMNGLAQYGVARGALIKTVVLDTKTFPAPASWDSSGTSDRDQLIRWLTPSAPGVPPAVSPTPVQDETQKVYLIFLPNTTQLTNGVNSDGTPNTSVIGWHGHAKYNQNSANDDLFWGVVETIGNTLVAGSEDSYVNGFAYGVAHELCETFTNRDGNGYFKGSCEIGDLCEADTANNLITFTYKTWLVEPYWSAWSNACIHGDAPVSLRNFLAAVDFDGHRGLRALGAAVIDLGYVASRMR